MPKNKALDITVSLKHFLQELDDNYRSKLSLLPIFDPEQTATWNKEQKKYFAAVFYHLRGHFINFMWYIANFSANEQTKKVVMNNIHEELGLGSQFSHERLYERFANECGVNIHDEIVTEEHYLPFAKEFNKTHLKWLSLHDYDERIAAFAAYERLDNLDYRCLVELAKSLRLSQQAMTFFNVHVHVHHFDSALELILPIWQNAPEKMTLSFDFIFSHQYRMWENLSATIFAYTNSSQLVN